MSYGAFRGSNNLFVFTFFCWMAGKVGDPHIIPAISTFLVYYIGFYVTCQMGADLACKESKIIEYILFTLLALNCYAIINNVRNVLAFCLIGFATFRDCYQKKRTPWTYLLYIFPLFLHESAILILILRFVMLLSGKIKAFFFVAVAFIFPILDWLNSVIPRLTGNSALTRMIRKFITKAYWYFNDSSSSWGLLVQKSTSFRMERFANIALAFIFCFLSFYLSEKKIIPITPERNEKQVDKIYSIMDYSFYLGVFTIACIPMLTPEYWRFFTAMTTFAGGIYLTSSNWAPKYVRFLHKIIFLFAFLCAVIWARGLLNSELNSLFLKPFISSPVLIFVNDVLNCFNVL